MFERLTTVLSSTDKTVRRVCRYQRGNQKPYVEGQTIQWPKEKGQTAGYKTLHRSSNTNPTKSRDRPQLLMC
jgi:hypothetical protein